MNTNEIAKRNDKSEKLKVFRLQDGQFYVESAEGKICYKVVIGNGTKSCSCADYTTRIEKDPTFLCKHILAVINGNGNIRNVDIAGQGKPRLDERFIKIIDGKEFALYAGLLDLAHQNHLAGIEVELVQYPAKDNEHTAVCRATISTESAGPYIDFGDANPVNCNSKVAKHLIRMASTRAKARALRDLTNVGITALEELGDLNDVAEDASRSRFKSRKEAKPEQFKGGQTTDDRKEEKKQTAKTAEAERKPSDPEDKTAGEKKKDPKASDSAAAKAKPSTAQVKAIESLAERRGINGEQLVKIFTDKFNKPYVEISADEAKNFINYLQHAA